MRHKLTTIAYAVAFVQDYVDNRTEPLEVTEKNIKENEYREEIRAMMQVINEGLTQLSKDVTMLNQKVEAAKQVLQ